MSLARSKDADLLQAFEGCYEGDVYLGEIDDDLFLLQVSFRYVCLHCPRERAHMCAFSYGMACSVSLSDLSPLKPRYGEI